MPTSPSTRGFAGASHLHASTAEAALLKTDAYKQKIAEALLAGIMRYQNSLKKGSPRAE